MSGNDMARRLAWMVDGRDNDETIELSVYWVHRAAQEIERLAAEVDRLRSELDASQERSTEARPRRVQEALDGR